MESDSPATVVVDPSSVSMEVAPHLDETANNESSTTALPVATTEEVEASNNNSGEPNADNDNDGDDATGDKATQDKAGGKKSRKRKKHIYNSIRETMEFYFSDANLSKDRFLMKLINENAEVPLSTFLTFNKIKAMASSVEEIEKAIRPSEKLRVSEDRLRVARQADMSSLETRNPDECTIYVEALPTNATHDWVRTAFEAFGPVAYVSLPKYHKTKLIKEFAFVEFEEKATVQKAIEAFATLRGVLNCPDPSKLGSILAYLREKDDESDAKKAKVKKTKSKKKSKLKDAKVESPRKVVLDEEPAAKRAKREIESESVSPANTDIIVNSETAIKVESSDAVPDAQTKEKSVEIQGTSDDTAAMDSTVSGIAGEPDDNGIKSEENRQKTAVAKRPDTGIYGTSLNALRITTKQEWKHLRNLYLNQQRNKMKQLKKQLWHRRNQEALHLETPEQDRDDPESSDALHFHGDEPFAIDGNLGAECVETLNTEPCSGIDAASGTTAASAEPAPPAPMDSEAQPPQPRAPLFTYEPGIIVLVHFAEPCVDVRDFKAEMRQHACVRYVDVKEGDLLAHIRIDANDSALELMARVAPLHAEVLEGDAERVYWQKIECDRHQKLTKQLKVKPVRGRERMRAAVVAASLELQANHVRFDD